MLKPKTLQQRLSLFMLLPVAVLLVAMGSVVFFYARNSLLAQWKEAAVLKLARAAHDVDMRLSTPKNWMSMYHKTAAEQDADDIREWVIRQLEDVHGVERVTLTRMPGKPLEGAESGACPAPQEGEQCYTWSRDARPMGMSRWMGAMDFEKAEVTDITPPRYDDVVEHETVSLTSDLLGKNGDVLGKLEVVIRFQYLIQGALSFGWSEKEKAFLVNNQGKVLACNLTEKAGQFCSDQAVSAAMKAMESGPFGTVIRPDDSNEEVVGFYKLKEAPWSLVVVSQSQEILAPIFRFRLIYFATMAVFFLLILLLIRLVAGRTVLTIRNVSDAANRVAKGEFDALPPVESRDEVGQLIRSFNEMVSQLGERIRLKEALDLAMQVQQNLLPSKAPRIKDLDIAGESIYCDETGGDYYDFITFSDGDPERVGIVVGDVAGHGISAALFMTTVRALLRSRMDRPGSLSDVMNDVNRLLCLDTSRTGDFMSLFVALVDVPNNRIRWVRAGHFPAILYDWGNGTFEELRGEGAAIGFDETYSFREYEYTGWNGTKLLFLGTDGIWETENPQGEMFGLDRLRSIIRQHCHSSPEVVIGAIGEALKAFRGPRPQEDDVTMVVVKSSRP